MSNGKGRVGVKAETAEDREAKARKALNVLAGLTLTLGGIYGLMNFV